MYLSLCGKKPDGYILEFHKHTKYNRDDLKWMYVNVKHIISSKYDFLENMNVLEDWFILIKKDQPLKCINNIVESLQAMKWKRIHLPYMNDFKSRRSEILMVYGPKCTRFEEWTQCKICKGDHTIFECTEVKCNICKTKGHLTRFCNKVVCGYCSGKHLTTRCKKYHVCNKCSKKGHSSEKCYYK